MSSEVKKGLAALKEQCPLVYKDIDSRPVLIAAEALSQEWMCSVVDAAAHICEMSFQMYLEENIN